MRKIFGAAAIMAGAVAFAQPAATRVPATQACEAGPFMVSFAANSDALSPKARAILDKAVAAYRQCTPGAVVVTGHTDRKGEEKANVGLSQRMAANVRSYLAAMGVPDGIITTEAYGESRPLVATKDGVAEAQNRRVEVTFGPGSGW